MKQSQYLEKILSLMKNTFWSIDKPKFWNMRFFYENTACILTEK